MGTYSVHTVTGLTDKQVEELSKLLAGIQSLSSSLRYYDHATGETIAKDIEKRREKAFAIVKKIPDAGTRARYEKMIWGG